MKKILEVKDLRVSLKEDGREILKGISFDLEENQLLGLVGESGSGKSITSLAIIQLLDRRVFDIEGSIRLNGVDLLSLGEKEMCRVRGRDISIIYQEPQIALNPLVKIERQVEECLMVHEKLSKKERRERIVDILEKVQLKDIEGVLKKYPYELSGGQLQRIMIGMGLISNPKILILDEPTTALDVTIQKEIISLVKELSEKDQMSMIFITHNLGLVAEICEEVIVMYKGDIIEKSSVLDFFDNPKEDYSKELLYARPMYL